MTSISDLDIDTYMDLFKIILEKTVEINDDEFIIFKNKCLEARKSFDEFYAS